MSTYGYLNIIVFVGTLSFIVGSIIEDIVKIDKKPKPITYSHIIYFIVFLCIIFFLGFITGNECTFFDKKDTTISSKKKQ